MGSGPRLRVVPCTQENAKIFITAHHRHHRPSLRQIANIAVVDETGLVRGVAALGRPVARRLDDGQTLEVSRVATDGCKNACSALLGAARRVAFALGYRRIYTYTLPSEGGASLRGAGWILDGKTKGGNWVRSKNSHGSKRRNNDHPTGPKLRWVASKTNDVPIEITWPEAPADEVQQKLFVCDPNHSESPKRR